MAVAAPPLSAAASLRAEGRTLVRPLAYAAAFAVIAAAYAVLGVEVTAARHVVPPEALDRLARAVLVWHGDPAKLAALGFDTPPLRGLVLLPLGLFGAVARSLVALPVTAGIFGAVTLLALERALAVCEVPLAGRVALAGAFGVNPLFAYRASGDPGEALGLALLALALWGLLAWSAGGRPRALLGAGLAFAPLVLARFSFAWWALLAAVGVGVTLARRRADDDEIEGSVLAFAAPAVYALALWTLLGALVAGDPFGWASMASDAAPGGSPGTVASDVLGLAVGGFPLALAVVPGLVVAAFTRRDRLAPWLAGLLVLGVAIAVFQALGADDRGPLALRNGLPIELTALAGAGWLARGAGRWRAPVLLATVALLAGALVLSWRAMVHYPVQSGEQAFTRAVANGEDQEGHASRGGLVTGVEPERTVARWLDVHVHAPRSVLVDEAAVPGVPVFAGHPAILLTRANAGDAAWRAALEHPPGRVRYLLLSTAPRTRDLVAARWGREAPPGATVALATTRETLLRVPGP